MLRQILTADQATSRPFKLSPNNPTFSGSRTLTSQCGILLANYAGGTWSLEVQNPGDENDWIPAGTAFEQNDVVPFWGFPDFTYRLNGGTAGATAWVTPCEMVL